MISGAVYREGVAYSPDGALYVAPAPNSSFANPTVTGSVTGGLFTICSRGVPFIHISSGSIGNNGALTGVTALGRIYSGGAYCYYPTNSISAATPAGWYWTVFSSTTAGTIFNSTYTSGVPARGTATAFATTGPGAFTGDTTERVGPSIPVAAGAMGVNGSLEIYNAWQFTNSAGTKTIRNYLGGTGGATFAAPANFTTNVGAQVLARVFNTGAANQQFGYATAFAQNSAIVGSNPVAGAIDTAVATTVDFSMTKNTATDNTVLETYLVALYKDGSA